MTCQVFTCIYEAMVLMHSSHHVWFLGLVWVGLLWG
jgi:hypothetical protein